MRIFPPEPEIGDEEGFTPSNDIFKRAGIAKGMTNLVTKVDHPLVVAVDGQWGSGKTVFLKMWAGDLRKLGFPVIYFDAFAHDYFDDAFSAIAHEIVSLAVSKKLEASPKGKALIVRAANAGKIIGRGALRLGVKLATAGAIDTEKLGDLADDLIDEAADTTDKLIDDYLVRHRNEVAVFDRFQEALESFPGLFLPQGSIGPAKPLVIIVDELDRCRPDFAVQILERIKHFFSVGNVHFVLGVHIGQLKNSIRGAYGSDIDAARYLEKFIHLAIAFVDSPKSAHERDLMTFIRRWTQSMKFDGKNAEAMDAVANLIFHVAEVRNFTFRTVERVLSNLALAMAFLPPNFMRTPVLLGGLCILKVADHELYLKAKAGRLSYGEADAALGLNEPKRHPEVQHTVEWTAGFWRHCLGVEPNGDATLVLSQFGIRDASAAIPFVANQLVDFWGERG